MIVCGKLITEELNRKFDDLEFLHYLCVAHILNLVVSRGFEHVDKSIMKVRVLMLYIRLSKPTSSSLKTFCNMKGITYLVSEIDIKTRWNSIYYMLTKLKELEPALNLLATDNQAFCKKYLSAEDSCSINVSKI
jgi:hypothetical protein